MKPRQGCLNAAARRLSFLADLRQRESEPLASMRRGSQPLTRVVHRCLNLKQTGRRRRTPVRERSAQQVTVSRCRSQRRFGLDEGACLSKPVDNCHAVEQLVQRRT